MILTALSVTLWFFYFCVTWQINLCWRSPLIEPTAENSLLNFAGSAVSRFTLGHVWSERVNEFGQMKSIIIMLTYCVISVYTPITYFNHYGHFSPWLSGKGRSFSTKCKVWSCQYSFACVGILLWVTGLFMSAWSCQIFYFYKKSFTWGSPLLRRVWVNIFICHSWWFDLTETWNGAKSKAA